MGGNLTAATAGPFPARGAPAGPAPVDSLTMLRRARDDFNLLVREAWDCVLRRSPIVGELSPEEAAPIIEDLHLTLDVVRREERALKDDLEQAGLDYLPHPDLGRALEKIRRVDRAWKTWSEAASLLLLCGWAAAWRWTRRWKAACSGAVARLELFRA